MGGEASEVSLPLLHERHFCEGSASVNTVADDQASGLRDCGVGIRSRTLERSSRHFSTASSFHIWKKNPPLRRDPSIGSPADSAAILAEGIRLDRSAIPTMRNSLLSDWML